jgi:hypothetical protein
MRTKVGYNTQCQHVLAYGEHFSKAYGINRKSVLNDSNFYHVVGGMPPDVMHDILEGVLQYEVKEMLKHFIKVEHYLSLDILNDRITRYDFGYYNDKNKPSPITEQKLLSNDNSLKQHGKFKIRINMIVDNVVDYNSSQSHVNLTWTHHFFSGIPKPSFQNLPMTKAEEMRC